jgi:DNA polymerase-4
MPAERRIIHLDMDAFYASVEQRDRPELRGHPVVVWGLSRRAVVAAASYEARRFGIRSAMPMFRARRLCPDLVVVELRMEHYRAVSQQIRDILQHHTAVIEPLALDECFLDVSATTTTLTEAGALARLIKEEIRRDTGLIASAGVGPNKFVAKIASALGKPDGLRIVHTEETEGFLAPLPVSRMWGVGAVTGRKLGQAGIKTIGDLAAADPGWLERLLGKHGPRMHEFAHGRDGRDVQISRQAKSVSNETTFDEDTTSGQVLRAQIERLAQRVAERLGRRQLEGRTIVLKLTYKNFAHASRRTTLPEATGEARVIADEAVRLLARSDAETRPVRLIGVGVAGLTPRPAGRSQLGFFGPAPGP